MAFAPLAHIMSKRARDRAEKKSARIVDHSPFTVAPRVGLYGYLPDEAAADAAISTSEPDLPFKCKSYHVEGKVLSTLLKIRITMNIMVATNEFDFYFPISECGDVNDVHTSIKGIGFTPAVVRRGVAGDEGLSATATSSNAFNGDTTGLIPSSDKRRFLADRSDSEDEIKQKAVKAATAKPKAGRRKEPALYYLHYRRLSTFVHGEVERQNSSSQGSPASPLFAQRDAPSLAVGSATVKVPLEQPTNQKAPARLRPIEVGNTVTIIVSYNTKLLDREPIGKRYHLLFPLTCAPIPPTSMNFELSMKENIQRIVSLNESHNIRPYYRGDKAEVLVTNEIVEDSTTGSSGDARGSLNTKSSSRDGKSEIELQNEASRAHLGNRARPQRGERGVPTIGATVTSAPKKASFSAPDNSKAKRVTSIMLEDYVFVLVIELGPVIIPQFADPMTLFILATAAAAFIFAALTKNLDDLN